MFKFLQSASLALALTFLIIPAQFIFVSDADARFRSSSSSFSRSSFRSSSRATSKARPSFNSRKAAPKPRVAAKPKPRTTFASTPRAARGQQATSRARFKSQPVRSTTTSRRQVASTYSSNTTYNRARSYDRGTYYSRRSAYYGTWNTPSYVYLGSPSYGLYSSVFLFHSMHTPYGYQMAYHYRNNSDYQAWRSEANTLAVENAELRTQLATMDAKANAMTGPVNGDFIPEGVDVDLMLAESAIETLTPEFRACVAGASGTYANLMTNIVGPGTSNVRVSIVPTSGSREILSKVSAGECDGGFVQGDSYWNYVETNETVDLPFERVLSPYKESVHLVCNTNAATTDGLADLTSANAVYFPALSGAEETWTNLVNENADYDEINAQRVGSYEEALQKAANEPNACALYVGATGSSELMRKTESGASTTLLELVEVVDSSILGTTDPSGSTVYSTGSLSTDTYANLLRDGGCWSACSGDVPTLTVNADFIIGTAWKAANKSGYDGFVLDLTGMSTDIRQSAIK